MATYSIGEVKANLGRILRDLEHGEGVIINRRGRPRSRLTAVDDGVNNKPSLCTLKGSLSQLPDADHQDFRVIRRMSTERCGGHDDR